VEHHTQPSTPQRVAAFVTIFLFALLGVVAAVLAMTNVPSLLAAWIGMAVAVFALTFELRSAGRTRVVWIVVAGAGGILSVASLVWLGWSSPWGLLIAALTIAAIRFLGSFALHQEAPVVGLLSAKNPVLFVNPASGGGKAVEAGIASIAARRGIRVRMLEHGDDLTELAADAISAGADAIAMAGGDGSLAYVASATIDAGVPFICIPAGTRNHFARDLGLDRADIVGALDAFEGEVRMVDYATLNDRVFLNVASLGLYAETVSDPTYREAKIETARETLRSLKATGAQFDLRYSDGEGLQHDTADLIMVSSGRYEIKGSPGDIGKRVRLDSGRLGVVTLLASNPTAAVEMATLWAAGAIDRFSGWDEWDETTFEVDSSASVSVGLDGETVSMEPPLRFEVHAGMFPVAVPRGTPYGPRVSPFGMVGSTELLWSVAMGGKSK
jgi:diacylglycerol kinase family enzyme